MAKKYDKIFNPKNYHLEFLTESQSKAWEAYQKNDIMFLVGVAGTGKALTLDSKVYTPNGYKLMRDIAIGDEVCSPDGTTSNVIGVYPQGTKPIYRITFKDGDFVDCCEEHLWMIDAVHRGTWKNKVVNTRYIIDNIRSADGHRKLSIKVPAPVYFSEIETIIDPYMMGVLLGDGCFVGSNVDFTTKDAEIVNEIEELILSSYEIKRNRIAYRIVKRAKSQKPELKSNIYKEQLKKYGLWKLNSHEKFIPNDYLYNSVKNRTHLLQGLLDTDGYVDKRGSVYFYTTSQELSKQIKELVCSLGGLVSIIHKQSTYTYKGVKKEGKVVYLCRIHFDNASVFFRLKRKSSRVKTRTKYLTKRIIDSVEYIGDKEAQCICVNNPNHLYLTNNFIVTHNSHLAVAFAIQDILNKTKGKMILSRPVVEAGENLGFLPGDLDEKVYPYMLPMYDVLEKICGREGEDREYIDKRYELAPLAYLRGRTFEDAVCILDEAQNCTGAQLKLFLTRLGKNSKMIITGDPSQSDLGKRSELLNIIEKIKHLDGIGLVTFDEESVVRHPLVSKIIKLI